MKNKDTDDLRRALGSDSKIETYIKESEPFFINSSIQELLSELYEQKSITKAELARRAGMSEVYLHQVFSGRRRPSRDRLLCICIGLEASFEETQRLLQQASYAQLYPRIKRDAIISHGIVHCTKLSDVNDMLYSENEKTLL